MRDGFTSDPQLLTAFVLEGRPHMDKAVFNACVAGAANVAANFEHPTAQGKLNLFVAALDAALERARAEKPA